MIAALLACSALTASGPAPSGPSADDLTSYEAARAAAGRDAGGQVALALWCERHGLEAQRLKHLALAVLADPAHATARGLLGMVEYAGRWQRPEAVVEVIQADAGRAAALAEYNARREEVAATADAQWELALWCEQHGLKPEATAHLTNVVRLDPSRESAWKHLGYKKRDGRWTTDAQLAAERAEAEAQKKADRRWGPLLEKWSRWLGDSSAGHREAAEAGLAGVTDPRAVPSVVRAFAKGGPARQAAAVRLLGQIDSPEASQTLAALALQGGSAEVRRAAAETLTRRDPREFVDLLIGQIRKPMRYEVRPVGGPGSPGVLFVEGERYNIQRTYNPPAPPGRPADFFDPSRSAGFTAALARLELNPSPVAGVAAGAMARIAADPAGATATLSAVNASLSQPTTAAALARADRATNADLVTVERAAQQLARNLVEAQKATLAARQQLASDLAAVEAQNAAIRQRNERVLAALEPATGERLGEDRDAWDRWWTDQKGYAYTPPTAQAKPTFYQAAPPAYIPQYQRFVTHHACFAAGTPVRTLGGPKPIETIQVGDQVLTQDIRTGALSYQPVLVVHHNPPNATLRVALEGDEAVVATGIHRFWKAGQGWVMARELTAGDVVRTLGGVARVASVDPAGVQPVFNLSVAGHRDFFVGAPGALVHDNSLVEATPEPFDAPPALASAPAPGE